MDGDAAIGDWAREIADREAHEARRAVREALLSGVGSAGALHALRRRMSRLTPDQQEWMIRAIVEVDETAA